VIGCDRNKRRGGGRSLVIGVRRQVMRPIITKKTSVARQRRWCHASVVCGEVVQRAVATSTSKNRRRLASTAFQTAFSSRFGLLRSWCWLITSACRVVNLSPSSRFLHISAMLQTTSGITVSKGNEEICIRVRLFTSYALICSFKNIANINASEFNLKYKSVKKQFGDRAPSGPAGGACSDPLYTV